MGLWKRPGAWFGAPVPCADRSRRDRPPPAPAWLAAAADHSPADAQPPAGCGWFDSSLDLREGLAVTEHYDINLVLAIEVALDWAGPATAAAAPGGLGPGAEWQLQPLQRQASRPARKSSTA
ncbi:hypothetical protein [Pseudorhodoferax sp.]|uniref:hypothetical protein n=1 Tax=Pseudorhodoferax sp. TaxID=1993553 RepID=UPI002DD683EC|nr:hypothetical protein [Pseudorhodoferax sp.]